MSSSIDSSDFSKFEGHFC